MNWCALSTSESTVKNVLTSCYVLTTTVGESYQTRQTRPPPSKKMSHVSQLSKKMFSVTCRERNHVSVSNKMNKTTFYSV